MFVEIKASLNHLRIAPRKVRLVADLVRSSSFEAAEKQLQFLDKKAAAPLLKLLKSAAANAKNNFEIEDKKVLFVKDIRVDEGPHTFKRWRPRAMGRAFPIIKKTSHVNLVLEAKGVKPKKGKKEKIETVKMKDISKLAKKEKKPTVEEVKRGVREDSREIDKSNEQSKLPEKSFDAPNVSKNRVLGRQSLGSLKKRFFRRKNV